MAELVTTLCKDEDLEKALKDAVTTKRVAVLEFMKPDNQVYIYMKPEVKKLAEEMKDKAVFYVLDVSNFKKYAEKFQVEALPAFVLMNGFVKKRHVVGTDNLGKAITQVYNKITASPDQNRHEHDENSGTGAASGREDYTAGQKTEPTREKPQTIDRVSPGESGSLQTTCSIL